MVEQVWSFSGPIIPKKHKNRSFSSPSPRLDLLVSDKFAFKLTKMLLKGFWKILIPLGDNGTFRFFLFVIAAKPLNQQILAFFSILLVSRLRLTCSVCDGTLETSYWKCRQWVLGVCKLVNIQNFIYNGHFGAKNHCCTVYTGISRFSIFEEVWWKVVFSVKSWETSRLYHVQEHSFGFHFEPKFIDFRQKLKFLAYFEIRDGKIRKNAYFPYKMRKMRFWAIFRVMRVVWGHVRLL